MGTKLPKANLNFNKYTQTELASRAQEVHNKMLAAAGFFSTPPVTMVALQGMIDNYIAALATARKGSKAQTQLKDNRKIELQNALRQLAEYVTYLAQSGYSSGSILNIDIIKSDILLSGFDISDDPNPVEAGQGLTKPIIIKAISQEAGKLKILIRQYTANNRNTLMYQVNYRTSAVGITPAGPWASQVFTSQNNILLEGLNSGVKYDWQIAAIGGRDTKRNEVKPLNYTPISSVVII